MYVVLLTINNCRGGKRENMKEWIQKKRKQVKLYRMPQVGT